MTHQELYNQLLSLPEHLQKEVEMFVEFLLHKQKEEHKPKKREFGFAKGLISISPDFDEPLDDFKEYM